MQKSKRRRGNSKTFYNVPFFLAAFWISASTVIEQRGHVLRTAANEWNLGMGERCVLAGQAVWFYAAKVLWPVKLAFMYPLWRVQADLLSSWLPLAVLSDWS